MTCDPQDTTTALAQAHAFIRAALVAVQRAMTASATDGGEAGGNVPDGPGPDAYVGLPDAAAQPLETAAPSVLFEGTALAAAGAREGWAQPARSDRIPVGVPGDGTGALRAVADCDPSNETLTCREREVLSLVVCGLANRNIARRLGISEKTVKNHLAAVFTKLGVSDRTQAALHAVRSGLVQL